MEVGDVDITTDECMADDEATDVKVIGIVIGRGVFTWLAPVTKTPNTF